jgi:hypothetical protein
MRHTVLQWVIKLLRLQHEVITIPNVRVVYKEMIPYVALSEKEGKLRGWNGDSKRRIAMERYVREHGDYRKRDTGLVLELVVRDIT